MNKMLQNVTFQPSVAQSRFVEIYFICYGEKPMKYIAEKSNVSRMTIWRWFRDKDFLEWMNDQTKLFLSQTFPERINTAIKKAKEGDFNFSKLLFEMEGEYIKKTKVEGMLESKQFIEISKKVDNLLPEQRKQLIAIAIKVEEEFESNGGSDNGSS